MKKNTVKLLANTAALSVPIILISPFLIRAIWDLDFTPDQYLSYAIGMASPFAALAGYLFVYLSFIQQTETSSFDKNERVFNQYLKIYQTSIENLQFTTLLKKGTINGIPDRKNTTENGKKALDQFFKRVQEYHQFDWTLDKPLKTVDGKSLLPNRSDSDKGNLSKIEASSLLHAVYSEEAFGQYIFVLKFLIEHSKSSNYPEFLGLFEASISYTEKIFLFHYCPLMLNDETVHYLKNSGFLQTFPEKHYRKFFSTNYWPAP
jgi:hypothetical protein